MAPSPEVRCDGPRHAYLDLAKRPGLASCRPRVMKQKAMDRVDNHRYSSELRRLWTQQSSLWRVGVYHIEFMLSETGIRARPVILKSLTGLNSRVISTVSIHYTLVPHLLHPTSGSTACNDFVPHFLKRPNLVQRQKADGHLWGCCSCDFEPAHG
jgi:hypothetical protein